MGVEVHRQKPKARTFLCLPQASLTHWPLLLLGGPWLHSFPSPSGMVLHPNGLLVQKPAGRMRYAGRSPDRWIVWLPLKHFPCFLSTHRPGRLPVMRDEGLTVSKTPASTMLSPAAPRTTSSAGLWVTPVAPKWILRLEHGSASPGGLWASRSLLPNQFPI